MKNKMSLDQLFRNAMTDDRPDITPDKAIEDRLNQYFLVKQPLRKVNANSFAGMFVWIFSMKALGLKAGFATVCMAYFLFLGNFKTSPINNKYMDTCQFNTVVIDSSLISKDSCDR